MRFDRSKLLHVKIGISAYDLAATELVALGQAAEEAGFESLWLGEHLVAPMSYASEHPAAPGQAHRQHARGRVVDPNTVLNDPLVALAGVAAVTSQLRVATGIYLLALRHPLVSARMTATLHDLSRGRLILGVGSGWLAEEFEALGAPFAERRSRYEECLRVIRSAWAGGTIRNDGPHHPFDDVQVCRTPIRVPLVLGGNTAPALRRAAAEGDGWMCSGTPSFEEACALRDQLATLRPIGEASGFPLWFRAGGRNPEMVQQYRAAGFENLLVWADQVWPADASPSERRTFLFETAAAFGLAPRR